MKRGRYTIRQRDVTDCGAACLAAVCAYYGLHVAVSRVRQMAGGNKEGTSILGIVEAALQLGLDAKSVEVTFESLALTTLPAIVHVKLSERANHYLVVMKISSGGILVMDPSEGRCRKIVPSAFREIWTGFAVILLPGEKFQPNEKRSNTDRIIAMAKPHINELMLALVCAVIVSLLGLSLAVYVRVIVDEVLVNKNMALMNVLSAIVITLLAIQFVVGMIRNRLVLKAGKEMNTELIMVYYRHLLKLPQTFFDSMRIGDMISRVNDAVKITACINDVAVNMTVDLLVILFSLVMMLTYNTRLALLIFLIVPVYLLLCWAGNRISKLWQRKVMESSAAFETQLAESIGAASTIKKLGLINDAIDKTVVNLHGFFDHLYKFSVKQACVHISADAVTKLFCVLLLWIGSYYAASGKISAGELLSFYALILYFSAPVLYLVGSTKIIQEALIAADRLFEIIDLQQETDGWRKLKADGRKVVIEFKDVVFAYGFNNPILNKVNLIIKGNSITGITGKSGSGKSTLASLLLRSYEPLAGRITINDIPLTEINRKDIADCMSIALQDPDLFSGTIAENITIGRAVDPEWLNMISDRLGITMFASLLPDGMNARVAEQGHNLSGGQKQRISIARALYRNPPVLILDEATSAVDAVSEEIIMQTIEWYKNRGNAVILITHSNTTLKICDNIAVLEDGIVK